MEWLFETGDWPARWLCGVWPAWLGWGTIQANWTIAAAYFLIPWMGLWIVKQNPEISPNLKVARWCAAFVVACGLTHLFDGLAFWWPAYRLNLALREATALISVWTGWVIWKERVRLLQYQGSERARKLLMELEAAVEDRNEALATTDKWKQAQLEERIRDHRRMEVLTKDLEEARRKIHEMEKTAVIRGDIDSQVVIKEIRALLHDAQGNLK